MRRSRELTLCAVLALLALLGGCRCGKTKKPVPVPSAHEVELVEEALQYAKYKIAIEELEKSPATALAAVRRRTAAPGTRDALVLKIMADRLGSVAAHRAWREQFSGSARDELPDQLGPAYSSAIRALTSSRHTLFWSERLLFHGGESEFGAAAAHLSQIGDTQAVETLALVAREPWANGQFLFDALDALARLGQGRAIADGLSAHDGPAVREGERVYGRAHARSAAEKMSPKAKASTEDELLTALEREAIDDVKRGSYVFVLGHVGSAAALPRLAVLRRTEWGQRLKPVIDEAMAAISEREARKAP